MKLTPEQIPPVERAQKRVFLAEDEEFNLQPAEKKRKVAIDDTQLNAIKKAIQEAINTTDESPARVNWPRPISMTTVTQLKEWVRPKGYVLHYKEKTKTEYMNGGRDEVHVTSYKIRVYW